MGAGLSDGLGPTSAFADAPAAYVEPLANERDSTAAGFLHRAIAFFGDHGITIERVMTDNGPCYRARAFAEVLATGSIAHRWTRPYRPQTNGKAERFNLTPKSSGNGPIGHRTGRTRPV